eukprot:scaffold70079_cov62-Phaeocystis_antarctica.AAC.6
MASSWPTLWRGGAQSVADSVRLSMSQTKMQATREAIQSFTPDVAMRRCGSITMWQPLLLSRIPSCSSLQLVGAADVQSRHK